MDFPEFQDLVDRLGDDLGRWPPERREAAQALLTRCDAARTLLRQATEMRALFAAAPRGRAPGDLAARIVALAAAETPPPPSGPGGWRGTAMRVLAWAQPVRARWRVAAVLVGCFAAGIALGGSGVFAPRVAEATVASAATGLWTPILR